MTMVENIEGYRYSDNGVYYVLSTEENIKTRQPLTKELRDKIIASVESVCENCNNYFPYPEVHHRNHDPSDNDSENLMVLCPNCHVILHREQNVE